jgi:predicted O-methyltransferase YrrM
LPASALRFHGSQGSCTTSSAREGETIAAKTASWQHAEGFVPESEALERARARAQGLGMPVIGPAAGALLRALCLMADARSIVEVGTGVGVSGLWMLEGMPSDGVLTTIDTEAEHLRLARQAFSEVGVRPARIRGITGRAGDVVSRLTEGGYDLVLIDADPLGVGDYLDRAVRLLRPGGVVVVAGALGDDRVGDPARRDPLTTALRETNRAVRDHPLLVPSLLPVSGGLLLGVRRRRPT